MRKGAIRLVAGLAITACVVLFPAAAFADTTVNFDGFAAGTKITNQYANLGGTGQGVVFGPLPGGHDGLDTVVSTPPAGQAQSAPNVADISTCFGCEFPQPGTTGTFAVQRSHVSVYAGLLGPAATCSGVATDNACAFVTLRAVDPNGQTIASTAPTLVRQGAGVHTLLSVSTPSAKIVGFEVSAPDGNDNGKAVAIDDLSFDSPSTPPPPDFTLTPGTTNVDVVQGSGQTDPIAIGRLGGSSGNINLAVSGTLPTGVHASISPNPAGGDTSTLTLTADPTAPPTLGSPTTITVTGTPASGAVGPASRSFTVTVGVKQAFNVQVEGSTNIGLAGCTVSVPVQVTRDLSFPGPVSLSVSGLPPGVTASFSPAQATFPNGAGGQAISLNLTTPATGQPVLRRTATIHATAPSLPEHTATFTVGGTCAMQYDPEVVSMQITQGTQLPVLPGRDPTNPAFPIRYSTIGQAAVPGTTQALAKLAAFKSTVVRVYADLKSGPGAGVQVPAVLNGARYDVHGNLVPLPGGPILPINSPNKLFTGLFGFGSDFLQDNYEGVYTFVLPSSWESGKIKLEADLLPAQSTSPPPLSVKATAHPAAGPGQTVWAPCTTSACQVDNKFAISEIPFLYTFGVTIRPVAMIVTDPYDATLPDPVSAFKWAGVVSPVQLSIEPYATTIDIGDIVRNKVGDDASRALSEKMWHYACDQGSPDHGWDVGIEQNDIRSAKADGTCWNYLPPGLSSVTFATVNAPEPLISVSHELFHLFGRPHASPGCGSTVGLGGTGTQSAEDWPSDQRGFLQSVGLAPVPDPAGSPFRLIPISPNTQSGQWFDFMSYCDHVGDGQPFDTNQNAWVSVHNWNAVLANFGYGPAHDTGSSVPTGHTSAAAVPSLQIRATVSAGGQVTIVGVDPVSAPPQPAAASTYQLTGTDASGGRLVQVPMHATFGHSDSRPAQPILMLEGVVPAANLAGIGVLSNGVTLASLRKSAHPPTVKLSHIPSFGRRFALVRWRAADKDRDPLAIEIDYSGNGGRTFSPIWMGPNRGSARVPARYLFRSTRARIRIAVSDGFQTTTAVSRRFASPGASPSVSILMPWPHLRQPNDAPLVLSGQAYDDSSRALKGARLRWMLGRRLLGTGARVTVSGLPAGLRRISLVARDRFGRQGVASIAVRLRATRPLFLKLNAPRALGRRTRSFRLTVSSSLEASLTVRVAGLRPQRFEVGRRTRRLTVHVPGNRNGLTIRLALRAGGLTRNASLRIAR
jgi:hypothetical protein